MFSKQSYSKLIKKKKKKSKSTDCDETINFHDFTLDAAEESAPKPIFSLEKKEVKRGDIESALSFLTTELQNIVKSEDVINISIPEIYTEASTAILAVSASNCCPEQTTVEMFEHEERFDNESFLKKIGLKALVLLSKLSLSRNTSIIDILENTRDEYGAGGIVNQFGILCTQSTVGHKVGYIYIKSRSQTNRKN